MNTIIPADVNRSRLTKGLKSINALFVSCFFLAGAMLAHAQTTNYVYVDPTQNWVGYMAWSPSPYTLANFPGDGGTAGGSWGTAALQASFNGNQATLAPNDNVYDNTSDPYWVNPDGTGANNMDASFYVENDPTSANPLGGSDVIFSGYCWANTLVTPYSTNLTAFVKEFTTGYGYVGGTSVPLIAGQPFSVQWNSSAGDIVQYGFEMVGPDVNPATVASYGNAIVSSNAPPAGPVLGSLPATTYVNWGTNVTLAANASGGNGTLTYQWQLSGINLTNNATVSGATNATLTLSNVTGSAEGNYTVVVKDSLNETAASSSYLVVFNPADLTFDPNATLLGYINFDDTSGDYINGFAYPAALLRGSISNGVAVMQPNTDLYVNGPNYNGGYQWTNSDGTPNAMLEQDFYIQNDALAGNTLTFSGYCPGNSVDPSYTASAWIEDFASDYSSVTPITTNLVAGQAFSITLPTNPGDHIQYGLRLDGLDNSAASPLTQGAVLVSIVPPSMTASITGGVTTLNFPAINGHNYLIQYKNNLTDATWQTLGSVSGNGATQTMTDPATKTQRFYRLSIQ